MRPHHGQNYVKITLICFSSMSQPFLMSANWYCKRYSGEFGVCVWQYSISAFIFSNMCALSTYLYVPCWWTDKNHSMVAKFLPKYVVTTAAHTIAQRHPCIHENSISSVLAVSLTCIRSCVHENTIQVCFCCFPDTCNMMLLSHTRPDKLLD